MFVIYLRVTLMRVCYVFCHNEKRPPPLLVLLGIDWYCMVLNGIVRYYKVLQGLLSYIMILGEIS